MPLESTSMIWWPEEVMPLQVAQSDLPLTVLAFSLVFSSAWARVAQTNAAMIAITHQRLERFMGPPKSCVAAAAIYRSRSVRDIVVTAAAEHCDASHTGGVGQAWLLRGANFCS